ncbi:MAG: chitobiase/beta-hexosaminidase C-terminal domain-containing protein, partial [Kiritimatiellia bacterium]
KPYGEGYIVSLSASVVIYLGPTLDIAIDQPGADIDTGIMMSGFGTIGSRVPLSRTPSDTEESPGWFGILDEEALNGSLARSAVPLAGSSSIDSWLSLLATPTVPSRLTFTYENVGNANLNFYTNNSYVSFDAWEPGPHTFMCDIEPGAHVLRWEASGYGYDGQTPGYSTLDAVSLEALPPRVWFLTPTQTVAESAGAVPVDLALEWPCGTPVNVSYLQSGNATAGADYSVSPAGTVTFAPGQTRTNFTVTVINDSAAEPGEFVLFTLSDGDGYRQGVPNQHALTILANDGIIELLQVILENGAAQTTNQTVQLLAVCSESPTDLLLSESPDFTDASWQSYADPVAFALSDGYGVKTVYVKARLALDGGGWSETGVGSATIERVACTLQDALDTDIAVTSGPDAAWFGQRTISHDGSDAAQSGPLPAYSYAESVMTTTVQGPVKLSFWWRVEAYYNSYLSLNVDGTPVSWLYGTTDWTYLTYRIPEGEHTLTWRFYQYYYQTGANCGWVDQLTVQPDWPAATFLASAQTVAESAGTLLIPIELDRVETTPVVVPFTLGGTATPGTDYTCEPSGSVTFAPGQTWTNLLVTLTDDTLPERGETILLTLNPESGALAGAIPAHTVHILYNDGAPAILALSQQNGATWATNRLVTLSVICDGTPTEIRISEDPLFNGADWQPFSATPSFLLSEGAGNKTIWAEVRMPLEGGGHIASDPFSLNLDVRPDLATALNVTEGQVASPGASPWFGQTTVSRDGAAAQSGAIGNNGLTVCSLTLEGEGTVGFWWKVSSEQGWDYLRFYADASLMASISGTSGDWAYLTHTFSGAGTHTLEWTYSKDGSASNGSDCGWVDQVDLSGWTFGKVATPTFLPPDGTLFDATLAVTVSCATAGAEIRYTLDGSEPTAASTLYTAPITLSATTTIRARASKTGRADSDLAQATYSKSIAPPSYLPIPGTVFSEPFAVTITNDAAGADIRFTTNGADPDISSQLYTVPVTVTTTTTFRARAFLDGYDPSAVAEATYVLSDIPAALDTGPLVVSQSENAPWFAQSAITFDGVDAMRSGAIGHSGNSWMEVVLTGPAKVSFRWKVSSENSYDWLTFTTNGVQHSRISGQTEWAQVSFALTQPGDVVLRWTYSKDGSGVVGEDAAFLDTLSILEPNQRTAAFTVASVFAREADGTREVTALLDEAAPADLYVPYALSGTATTGDDYTIAPAAFFFAAGGTQAVATVTLTDDAQEELAETLILTLLPTNNVTVASPSQHTLTLLPSDFPQAQPGLIGWWRADDGVITNAAGGVTNWLDRSGYRQAFAQTSDTRCPMWLADAANGKPAIRFDLTDDGMASGLNVQAPYTVYLVYASQDPSTAARRALQGSSNWMLGPYQAKQRHYAGAWIDDASLTTLTGRYAVCTARNTGTASTFWVDGVNRTAYADAAGAPGTLHLGASGYASGEKLGGDIVEILVYDRALNDAETELPGDALSAAYRIDTAYSPTVITLATQDQTLPEGTRQWIVEGTASGPAQTMLWSNRVSGASGTVSLPENGSWQVTLPLARGANQFSFWTLHSTAATLSLTVSGALEPFAVAMNDSGELRLARWKTDMHAFESWQPFDSVMGNGYARGLAVGDFDNDGFNDILAFRPSGPRHAVATLFKNDGSNRFVRAGSALVTGYNSSYVMRCAAADFNLDGHLDVALTGNGNNIPVFLLLGDGTGRFTQRNVPVVNGYGRGLTSADFDHDGCPDLAVSFYSSGAVHVLYGRGDGTFEPPVQIGTVSNDPYGLVALDVNQDGHPDLLCRSGGSAQTTLFAGNGNRQFAAGV